MKITLFTLALFSAASLTTSADACSTFCLVKGPSKVVANNYDWSVGEGAIFLNNRGLEKTSLAINPGDKPFTWTATEGSITLSQIAREFPWKGMNESGVIVDIMWLNQSKYEPKENDPRGTVNELQWIQFQLDTAKTLSDVIENAKKVRLSPVNAAVHYLACDKTGACASFEYLGGKLVRHDGPLVNVLTNDTWAESKKALDEFLSSGKTLPKDESSISRFIRAAVLTDAYQSDVKEVNYAFGILRDLAQRSHPEKHNTTWSVVYDPAEQNVFVSTKASPKIRYVKLNKEALACSKTADKSKMLDVNVGKEGDVTGLLAKFDLDANRKLAEQGLAKLKEILPIENYKALVELVATYPLKTKCVN